MHTKQYWIVFLYTGRKVDYNNRNTKLWSPHLRHTIVKKKCSPAPLHKWLIGILFLISNNPEAWDLFWPVQSSTWMVFIQAWIKSPELPSPPAHLILYPGQVPSGTDSWFNGSPCSVCSFVNFLTTPLPSAPPHQSYTRLVCHHFLFSPTEGRIIHRGYHLE